VGRDASRARPRAPGPANPRRVSRLGKVVYRSDAMIVVDVRRDGA
jgi:hypothetical protein